MKNALMVMVLTLAVAPVRAQSADLSGMGLKTVRATPIPDVKPVPAPVKPALEKGYTQGSTWFHYATAGTSEQDGSSLQMDFTADEVANISYHHYSFGKFVVRFYTGTDIENPAKVQLSFKPGDPGMNHTVPKVIKKAMTHAKDEYGFYYYADISREVSGARLEANGQIFAQEISFTKRTPGGSVTYQTLPMRLFYSVNN